MNYSKGIYSNIDWLIERYVTKQMSLRVIAKICKTDFKTIHYWVRKFNLPRQPVGGMKGIKNPGWKGGIAQINKYKSVLINGRYFPEHRIIAATILKRGLKKGEVIHHIDINQLNNDPSNLYVFPSQKEHKTYHQALKHGLENILKSNLINESQHKLGNLELRNVI